MDLHEIGYAVTKLILQTRDWSQWRTFLWTVTNVQGAYKTENILTGWVTISFSRILPWNESVTSFIVSRVGVRSWLIDGVLGWMIWFIDTLITQFGTAGNYSAIALLHTLQFTATHALGFSVFTSRILATGLFIYLNRKWVFTRWQWYYNKTQHTKHTSHKITHHTQNSTQNYTSNKGHTTQNEYNANVIFTTTKTIQLQLNKLIKKQACYTRNSNSNGLRNVISTYPNI
jgi:hypothetical protein